MNKLLLILFLSLQWLQSAAQKIHFTDTTNVWRVLVSVTHGSYTDYGQRSYTYKGSLKKDSFTYFILSFPSGDSALIREDTMQGKVYAKVYRADQTAMDTNDVLLYDFSQSVGDTLKVIKTDTANSFYYYLYKIDSIQINASWHKVFYYNGNQNGMVVIEGIGSLSDPISPFKYPYFEFNLELSCFSNQGNYPPFSKTVQNFDNAKSCADTSLKISDPAQGSFTIFPQPSNGRFTIRLGETMQDGQIMILNNMGQIVYQKNINGTRDLVINDPAIGNGLFHFKITDNQTGESFTGNISTY